VTLILSVPSAEVIGIVGLLALAASSHPSVF
jgi:hypothetical protein